MNNIVISLTQEQIDIILTDLSRLESYLWGDDTKHASCCFSRGREILEGVITDAKYKNAD